MKMEITLKKFRVETTVTFWKEVMAESDTDAYYDHAGGPLSEVCEEWQPISRDTTVTEVKP